MHEQRVQFALDQIIEQDYFLETDSSYLLEEKDDGGKSALSVDVAGDDNLCIANFDKKHRCGFLKQEKEYGFQKCSDHLLFQKFNNEWIVHIFEMKTSVGYETWQNIRKKTRSSYLNALAIAAFLGILVSKVEVITTYENDKGFQSPQGTTTPALYKPPLGPRSSDDPKSEWDTGIISIEIGEPQRKQFPHKKVKMLRNADTGVLQGAMSL